MSRKKSSASKVSVVDIGGEKFAFPVIKQALDVVRFLNAAIPVDRDYDGQDLYRPLVKKYALQARICLHLNCNFIPSEKQEIIEPEIIPASQRPRLNGATAPEILRLH